MRMSGLLNDLSLLLALRPPSSTLCGRGGGRERFMIAFCACLCAAAPRISSLRIIASKQAKQPSSLPAMLPKQANPSSPNKGTI